MVAYAAPASFRSGVDECGCTFQFMQGPSMAPSGWLGVWYYFSALQLSWQDSTGTVVGGGHFGVQWGNSADASKHHAFVNFGVYDNTAGAPALAVFRGSIPSTTYFRNDGGTESHGFDWVYGDLMTFRVFKSPKQNYLASELTTGDGQSAPYVGTNQQANEVAYRCMIKLNNNPPIFYRDVLIKGPATTRAITGLITWLEPAWNQDGNAPSFGANDWPYNPIARIGDLVWDGRAGGTVSNGWTASYSAVTNSNVAINGNWIEFKGGLAVSRTTANGATIVPPSTFWKTAATNVTATPNGLTRTATPRPWF